MVLFSTRADILSLLGMSIPVDSFFLEIVDIVIMSLVLGYIFKDIFNYRKPVENYDPLKEIRGGSLNKENLKFAIMAIAPAIVLHEMAHKFVALAYGVPATFYAAYGWLILGLVLKLMNFNFIFFVPGFVSHGMTDPTTSAIIAVSGPAVHLILWVFAKYALKKGLFDKKYTQLLVVTKYVNGFLLIINMLPIPGIDGWHVYTGIWSLIVGV
ncbi:M50 family metallopeptidase [Nanoarchaeota archaeon]